jgi:hypothetical protein
MAAACRTETPCPLISSILRSKKAWGGYDTGGGGRGQKSGLEGGPVYLWVQKGLGGGRYGETEVNL